MSQVPLVTEDLMARQPAEAQAITRLLLAMIAELDARVSELEARLNKTPRNSSLPPGTEHPLARPASKKTSSGKKPGGQPGHPNCERALIPPEQCHDVQVVVPETCCRCGELLRGRDPEALRHQVFGIPQIKHLVTEYRLHRLTCPGCSISTCDGAVNCPDVLVNRPAAVVLRLSEARFSGVNRPSRPQGQTPGT